MSTDQTPDESVTHSSADPYVYWLDGDDLIIVRQSTAEGLAWYADILQSSKTFGEYAATCRAAGGTVIESWAGSFDDPDEWDFEDDEPFDVARLPGYGDGYLPPNPQTVMIDEIDEDIREELGDLAIEHDEMGGMPWIEIPARALPEVVAVFTRLGAQLIERPDGVTVRDGL